MRNVTRMGLIGILMTAAAALASPAAQAADPLPSPDGRTIPSVSGAITTTNNGDTAQFDLEMLKALGVATVTTSTAWTEGVSVFEGVRLADVLDRVGASGETLTAVALNDYAAELPAEDSRTWPVILAYSRDGKSLSVRDKGPLWIVYPRDDHPELQSDTHNGKWVWQLKAIKVK